MFQPLGVILRLNIFYTIFYKPEDDPKGLKHVAL